ncbi:MAG TPA: sigma-70 family RNA polymerase sigma factor [Opitutaceae bacterium]
MNPPPPASFPDPAMPPPPADGVASAMEQARWFLKEVHPHEAAVRGYLRNHFPRVDADDVVQESYLKLLRAKTAGKIASVKAYLFAVARNTAVTLGRRQTIYAETPLNELPPLRVLDNGPDAANAADASQRFALMREAIDQLPPRCRDVMRLAALRGLANAEIAAELGLAENTVRVHLGRAIKKCADYLRERGEHP